MFFMSPPLQTFVALVIVAAAVICFALRWWRSRNKPGCGGGCGCPVHKKTSLVESEKKKR